MENYGLLALMKRFDSTTVKYWRTKSKAEVDFVLETGLNVIPIEAKYSNLSGLKIQRSYRSFLERYQPKAGYIVHLGG